MVIIKDCAKKNSNNVIHLDKSTINILEDALNPIDGWTKNSKKLVVTFDYDPDNDEINLSITRQ